MTTIRRTDLNFEREPMAAPWGFKGGYLTELWQSVALLEAESGQRSVGLGVQSVLWCDPAVFASTSEPGGNAMMLLLTAHALREAAGMEFDGPLELLDRLLPSTQEYGRQVTKRADLRLTFALNALVAVDNAAWLLHALENGITDFDALVSEPLRPALSHRHDAVAAVPAVGYGLSIPQIVQLVGDGFFVLKIKVGSDPEKDGDPEKMLAWDRQRMSDIHAAVGSRECPSSPTGRVLYYLDANGRYDSKARLLALVEHLETIGALEQTVLLEEPFPEEVKEYVGDLPVRVVADESATTVEETRERLDLGYGAVALKPIAKTMSMSLRVAQLCHERGVPAFCADLTVNPVLVDWNKVVAARLAPIPGFTTGMQEVNGFQNYRDWDRMRSYHPAGDARWAVPASGLFSLDERFHAESGGIFTPSAHYSSLVR
jgi:L-alanine-DL-glutamate epimerase-like enolase superfamily enzyme